MKDTVDMTIQQHLLLIASEMKRLFKGSNKQVMRQKMTVHMIFYIMVV